MERAQLDVPCQEDVASSITPDQQRRLARARRFIESHFSKQPRLPSIAEEAGLSPFHFHRLFRRCYGETVKQLMTRLQIEYAQTLLLSGVPTRDVGLRSGFANQSHFTSRFKLVTGSTPAAWRRRQKANRDGASPANAQIMP